MKKLLPLALLALATIASCSKQEREAGYGSLKVNATTDKSVIVQSRAANLDPETYYLTLRSEHNVVYDGLVPSGGTISNLPAGTYAGTLKSAISEFTVPEFDSPFYSATVKDITITDGGTTSAEFVCKQSNAGVRFICDPSLAAAGYSEVIPVVIQSGYSLKYSGDNISATGYFAAGDAVLKLFNGEAPLPLLGSLTEMPLTFEAKELWTITIKAGKILTPGGKASISITIDVDDIVDRELVVTIDPSVVPVDPSSIVLRESFANCTGSNKYPVEGETFNTSGSFPNLATPRVIADAGLAEWTFTNGYTCINGLKMGTSTGDGIATTPPLAGIGAAPANVLLSFLAANWETSPIGLKIEVAGGGSVTSPEGGTISLSAGTGNGETISAEAAMKRYSVVIDGATKNTQITFAPASSKGSNRYFLADVLVSIHK